MYKNRYSIVIHEGTFAVHDTVHGLRAVGGFQNEAEAERMMKGIASTDEQFEDFYRSEGFDTDTVDEFVKRDESLMGGKMHGPSNVAGMTRQEHYDSYWEYVDEQERLRDEW